MPLFTSGGLGLGLKNLVLFTSLPDPLAGGACCPLPKNPTPLSAFGLDFRPCLIRQPLPTVFISPNANTGSAHFRSQRMHQNAGFCIKNIQKNPGVTTPGPHRRKGRHLFAPTPCPPARCWCPSASSRLATALPPLTAACRENVMPSVCLMVLMLRHERPGRRYVLHWVTF